MDELERQIAETYGEAHGEAHVFDDPVDAACVRWWRAVQQERACR